MAMPSASPSPSMAKTKTTNLNLPAGFRFHPTDEELIVHYLMNQAAGVPCPVHIIAEVNIYRCDPWELPGKAVFGDSEWFFFSPRDRKYPNGARPNRAAGSGYWKATGTDKAILMTDKGTGNHRPRPHHHVGVKKALVFYAGRPPRGVKTDWIMHEYRLVTAAGGTDKTARRRGSSMRLDDWVLCRIHHKKSNDFVQVPPSSTSDHHQEQEQEGSSTVEDESSPTKPVPREDDHLLQFQFYQAATMTKSCSLTDLLNSFDDCPARSQILDGPSDDLLLPQQSPLIYPPTTHQTTDQALVNNFNNNLLNNSSQLLINLPDTEDAAACSADYYAAVANNNSCNNDNGVNDKRKRTITAGVAESFDDDGSNGFSIIRKPKVLLPSDGFGSTPSSSSSYCNQQVVDTASGLFRQYSTSSLLMMSYPFLEMQ